MVLLAGKSESLTPAHLPFDQAIWREQILTRLMPFTRNPLHELRLSGTSSALSFLLFHTIQPFCAAFEHEPIAAALALAELTRRPGANYLVHNARRFYYQGAGLVERELRHTPELRIVLDELALELRSLQIVLQRLSNPRVEWLRRALLQDLGFFSAPQEFQYIKRQIADPEWQSRFAELQVLRLCHGVYSASDLDLLSQCLQDGSSHVRSASARLLGQANMRLPDNLVYQLMCVAVHDDNLETRYAAARSLGGLRGQVAMQPLLDELHRLLGDDDHFVRSAAAMVLGQLGECVVAPAINDALAGLLSDSDPYVREAAARALGRIGAPAAIPRVLTRLARAVEDGDANVHDAALEALHRLRTLRGSQPLVSPPSLQNVVA